MKISEIVLKLRTDSGMTQKECAEKCGVSIGLIRDIEQGRRSEMTWEYIQRLARGFGVSCEAFKTDDAPAKLTKPKKRQ